MLNKQIFDDTVWKQKAMAFVIRSHRHLWGKNNEDPLAFLFNRGLTNQFAKEGLLGWNKFGQKRSAENWGQTPGDNNPSEKERNLFLPSGIVVPFIVEQQLKSIFIHEFGTDETAKTTMVPGSSTPTMLLREKGNKKIERIAVVHHVFDGLFLFQESQQTCCVLIHPDLSLPVNHRYKTLIRNTNSVYFFSADKTQDDWFRREFTDLPNPCFSGYQSKEELKTLYLGH